PTLYRGSDVTLSETQGAARRSPLPFVIASLLVVFTLAACSNETPSPAATLPPPTVIVITAEGPYIATFDDPGSWLVGDSENSMGLVHDGEYFLSIKKPRALAWAD